MSETGSESGPQSAGPGGNPPEDRGSKGPETGFKGKAIRGSAIALLQTGFARSISLVCQIIFARLLVPSDFGLAAIAIGTISLLNLAHPETLEDLLIQRGKRLANALPSAWRLMTVTCLLTSAAILISTQLASNRPGDRIIAVDGEPATGATALGEIQSNPSLPALIDQIRGDVVLTLGSEQSRFELPRALNVGMTLEDYVEALESRIDAAIGRDLVQAFLDPESDRVVLRSSDGAPLTIETSDPVSGNILEVLGVPTRSNTVVMLLALLAIQPLIMLLRTPFAAAARLSLRFEQIAIGFLVGDILGYSLAIVIVFLGGGPIGLIIPLLVLPLTVMLNSMRLAWPLPKVPREEREPMFPILKDATRLCLGQWAMGISRHVPPLILAFFVTDSETGLYNWAALISVQVNVLLTQNLRTAMVPIFSNLQTEPKRLVAGFLQASRAMSGLTMPLFAGAAAVTPVLIPVVFGEKWVPAIPIAATLLVAQSFNSTNSICISLLKGTGRYRIWINLQFARAFMFIATAVFSIWLAGSMGLAWGMFAMITGFSFLNLFFCVRGHAGLIAVLRIYAAPLIACFPFILVAYGALALEPNLLSFLVWCPLMLLGGLVIYIAMMRVLDRNRYEEVSGIFRDVIGKIRSTRG